MLGMRASMRGRTDWSSVVRKEERWSSGAEVSMAEGSKVRGSMGVLPKLGRNGSSDAGTFWMGGSMTLSVYMVVAVYLLLDWESTDDMIERSYLMYAVIPLPQCKTFEIRAWPFLCPLLPPFYPLSYSLQK